MPNSILTTGVNEEKMSLPDAIKSLNLEDVAHWTKAGEMNLNLLKELTGRHISREEASATKDEMNDAEIVDHLAAGTAPEAEPDVDEAAPAKPVMGDLIPPKGIKVCLPGQIAAGYRNGPDGTIETTKFSTGFIPKGWHPTPAGLENFTGWKTSTVVEVRRHPNGKWA